MRIRSWLIERANIASLAGVMFCCTRTEGVFVMYIFYVSIAQQPKFLVWDNEVVVLFHPANRAVALIDIYRLCNQNLESNIPTVARAFKPLFSRCINPRHFARTPLSNQREFGAVERARQKKTTQQ